MAGIMRLDNLTAAQAESPHLLTVRREARCTPDRDLGQPFDALAGHASRSSRAFVF
jgi:hypothetical protein